MSEGVQGILSKLSTDVQPQIISVIEEATEVRKQIEIAPIEIDPADLHAILVHNRAHIERLEHLTSTMVLLKSRTLKLLTAKKDEYEDAYMRAVAKPSVGFGGESFATAKEKDAHYNLAAVDEMLQMRKADALHRDVDSAWDYCRILLRGAEQTQRDNELRVRLISLTSALER